METNHTLDLCFHQLWRENGQPDLILRESCIHSFLFWSTDFIFLSKYNIFPGLWFSSESWDCGVLNLAVIKIYTQWKVPFYCDIINRLKWNFAYNVSNYCGRFKRHTLFLLLCFQFRCKTVDSIINCATQFHGCCYNLGIKEALRLWINS